MTEPIDQEVEAIKALLAALTPLSEKARASVMDYVAKRLSVPTVLVPPVTPGAGGLAPGTVHIKEFKEEKRPRSANEMAAVVGYYLANLAPTGERKQTVTQRDIETYFKIAKFPLPGKLRMTLVNAKNAGYFDLSGAGQYKLNAVGYNLVEHGMPRGKA